MQPIQANTVAPTNTGVRPVIIHEVKQNQGCCSSKYPTFKSLPSGIFGGAQILLGLLSIIFQASAMSLWLQLSVNLIGYAYFSPILWFISGSFGMAAACTKNHCTIVTSLVMNIVSAGTMLYFIPLASIQLVRTYGYDGYDNYYHCNDGNYYDYESKCKFWTTVKYLDIAILAVGILEGIVAIICAVFCCGAVCCGRRNDNCISEETMAQVQYIVNAGRVQQVATVTRASAPSAHKGLEDVQNKVQQGHQAPDYVVSDQPPPYQAPDYVVSDQPPPYTPDHPETRF